MGRSKERSVNPPTPPVALLIDRCLANDTDGTMVPKLIARAVLTFLLLALVDHSAGASPTKVDWEEVLDTRGYELSEAGVREALSSEQNLTVFAALNVIEKRKYINLLPDVRARLKEFETREYNDEGSKLIFVQTILAIDTNLSDEELQNYLKRIRRLLYDVKEGDEAFRGVPVHAYNALLAAQKYQNVEIYDDLLYLSCSDIMKGGEYPIAVAKLFELYGDRVTETNLDTILSAWADWPDRQEYILAQARAHGMRLEAGLQEEKIPSSEPEK